MTEATAEINIPEGSVLVDCFGGGEDTIRIYQFNNVQYVYATKGQKYWARLLNSELPEHLKTKLDKARFIKKSSHKSKKDYWGF